MVTYKKMKSASIIIVIAIFIFCGITNSFAASKTTNAKNMAIAKMYFRSLYWCVGSSLSEYTHDGGIFTPNDMRTGDWFHSAKTTHAGAYIEGDIETNDSEGGGGTNVDDQFYCGNNDTLIHSSINAFNNASGKNLTVADFACGPNNNDGVFTYSKKIKNETKTYGTCRELIDDEDYNISTVLFLGENNEYNFRLNGARQNNVKTIVQQALGSDPSKFSDEEMYYVLRLGFEQHCTTVNSKNGAATNGKKYKILDSEGNLKEYTASTKAFGIFRTNTENNVGLFQSMTEDAFAYQDESGNMKKGQIGTCSDLERMLSDKNNKYTKAFLATAKEDKDNGEHVADGPEDTAPEAGNNYVKEDDCKKVSGLAWLLCPIIEMAGDAVDGLYANMVEPMLQVRSELMDGTGSSTQSAWGIFRNFSNIFLIIFLLVIVFSQLTGYGIDNYGIKKTLPKLIVAAVLINISYFICQAAVDLSNLLGYSLHSMFNGFIDAVGVNSATHGAAASKSGAAGAAAAGIGIVGGSVAIISAVGAWPAIGTAIVGILPAVIAALVGALVAIFFFFVLLGVRQAAIVMLVVVSPLAFACYMLPNTKSIFDKWKKAFTGALLVYPIAGALIGGGNFASAVLLNAGGSSSFWYNLVALLVSVMPFFLMPSILKNSFSALGNIGNKISGFGKRMGGRASGAAKRKTENSGAYKGAQLKMADKNYNSKLNQRRRARLDRLAENKTGRKFSDMDAAEKQKFLKGAGIGAMATAANLSKASAKKLEANKQLNQDVEGADANRVIAAMEKDNADSAMQTDNLKNFNKDYISTIDDDDGNTYFGDGNGNFSYVDDNGNTHSLNREEVNRARQEGRIKRYEGTRGGNEFKDANGNVLSQDKVAAARQANKLQTFGGIKISQNQAKAAGEVAGAMAMAGVAGADMMSAARSTQFGTAMSQIDNDLEGNVEAFATIEEGGEIYFADKNGEFKSASGVVLAASAVEKAKNEGRVKRYTGKKGSDVFRDASGKTIDVAAVSQARTMGVTQSLADLKQVEAAGSRTKQRNALVGGVLGESPEELAMAAGLSAENEAITSTSNTLGNADAISYNRTRGRNTATTRTSAAQAAEHRVEQTMSTNAGAQNIQDEVNASLIASGNIYSGPSADQRIGRTETQVTQAVRTGATRLESQFVTETEANRVGTEKTTRDAARIDAEQRLKAEKTKNAAADKTVRAEAEITQRTGMSHADLIREAVETDSTRMTNVFKSETARQLQGEANLDYGVAQSRSQSMYTAQQNKAYQDQYASFTRPAMEEEFKKAFDNYSNVVQNRNSTSRDIMDARIRLNAASSSANAAGLGEQMIEKIASQQTLPPVADQELYFQALQNSGEPLLANYAKEQAKNIANGNPAVGLHQFITGTGPNSLETLVNSKKGKLVSSFTEDTLKAINNMTDASGNSAAAKINPEYLIEASAASNDGKIQAQVRTALSAHNDIPVNLSQMSNLDDQTVMQILGIDENGNSKGTGTGLISQDARNRLIKDAKQAENATVLGRSGKVFRNWMDKQP